MKSLDEIEALLDGLPENWELESSDKVDGSKTYSIKDAVRTRFGDTSLVIGEDEATASFIATAPQNMRSLVTILRNLLQEAKFQEHNEECSYVTTYSTKSLDCDCLKGKIPQVINEQFDGSAYSQII